MFGYVRTAPDHLTEEEQQLFRSAYCGLCHTLGRRYGAVSRMILNYDLTFLAILLSEDVYCSSENHRCMVHPFRGRMCARANAALELAADYSVILTWWQLRDGIADHGFFRGLKYRAAAWLLRRAYRKARQLQPEFDRRTREQLDVLETLERQRCASMDQVADTFAQLLAAAAEGVGDPVRRRVLTQLLYHLGRWVYLVDAADDLERDARDGNYNPLLYRFNRQDGGLTAEQQAELARTLDLSIRQMAAAYELLDFGIWSNIICSVVYEGLYVVGTAVLNGTFRRRSKKREKKDHKPTRKAGS